MRNGIISVISSKSAVGSKSSVVSSKSLVISGRSSVDERQTANDRRIKISILNSRRGFIADTAELIFCIIAYVIFIIIMMFFVGSARVQVEATLNAENAHFACDNNLMSLMQMNGLSGERMDNLLIRSYIQNKYTDFNASATRIMNALLGPNRWQLSVDSIAGHNATIGQVKTRGGTEDCVIYLPAPCEDELECKIEVSMVVPY